MNKYSINDYIPRSQTSSLRLEVCYTTDIANQLLSIYKSKGWKTLCIAQLLKSGSERVALPDEILPLLREQLANSPTRTIVTGVNGYLSLLDPKRQKDFFYGLRSWLDERSDLNAAILFNWTSCISEVFFHPKYNDSLLLSIIKDNSRDQIIAPKINVTPEKWILSQENVFSGFKELLVRWGDFGPKSNSSNEDSDNSVTVSVNGDVSVQPGLSNSIVFCQTIQNVLNVRQLQLPDSEAEAVLNHCKQNSTTPERFFKSKFENAHNDPVQIFKILYSELDNPLWKTFAAYNRTRTIPHTSCLAQVLAENDLTPRNFLHKYAVEIPLRCIKESLSSNSTPTDNSIPEERKEALQSLPPDKRDSLVHDFINAIHDYPSDISVLKYLNSFTDWEYREILRRVFSLSDPSVIPNVFLEFCPLLKDYLSGYDYGSEKLNSYFREYRQLRATNRITPEFVRLAFEATVPDFVETCQYKLNSLKNQDDLGLLIIDGLGAEYMPFLIALARSETRIESSCIVKAKLPTSTCFNPIEQNWSESRIVDKFQDLDNIAHQEAVKGNDCAPEENFLASLNAVRGIINKVKDALERFSRVVVTADHGLSRLAVLAYENGLVETLPEEGDDWRYVNPGNKEIPEGLENKFVTDYDSQGRKYWIVRGYNRLKKSGGKSNELHGGATLEEQLIPFIIFSKGSESVPSPPYVAKPSSSSVQTSNAQIEEEDLGI